MIHRHAVTRLRVSEYWSTQNMYTSEVQAVAAQQKGCQHSCIQKGPWDNENMNAMTYTGALIEGTPRLHEYDSHGWLLNLVGVQ
jgi:hypothetical protein